MLPAMPPPAPRMRVAPAEPAASGKPPATGESAWTADQLADFATLLVRDVSKGYFEWLAVELLGPDAYNNAFIELGNDVDKPAQLVRSIVDALAAAGRIPQPVARL